MAAKVGNDSGDEVIGDINVVPLVDIMLVLVIILMVTAEFTKYRTVPIQLPKVNAVAMKREPHKVAITIKQIHCEEESATGNEAAAIVRHAPIMSWSPHDPRPPNGHPAPHSKRWVASRTHPTPWRA